MGAVECRGQWRQEGHNAPRKSWRGNDERIKKKEKKKKVVKQTILKRIGSYRERVRGEGIFPKGYVRALRSVSARHSLTSARAWIIPERDKHKVQEGVKSTV